MSVSLTNTPPSPTHNAPLSKYSLTSFGLIPPVGIRGTPGNIEDNVFGLIYLDIAENYLKSDKLFIKKVTTEIKKYYDNNNLHDSKEL